MKSLATITPEQLDRIFDAAIARGTHSVTREHLCQGCYQWVPSIYYITTDHKELCPACADKCGQGPKSLIEQRARFNLAQQAPRIAAAAAGEGH